jgi:hypothetical protein
MTVSHEPAAGYDLATTAARLAGYARLLRELVHLTAGHLALEPRFDAKALLADHLHDDARATAKLHARLEELGAPEQTPRPHAALLDRAAAATTPQYVQLAYGEIKPALIAAVTDHLDALDPLAEEPTLRILTQLRHRQERHVAELPADGGAEPPPPDLDTRLAGPLHPLPRLDRDPARDPFVTVVDETPAARDDRQAVHDLLDAKLCAAELLSRTSHEHPDMPLGFHLDMARSCWDAVRHAEVLDRLMTTALGCRWGDFPVAFGGFRQVYALDLPGRLAALSSARTTLFPGSRTFDLLRAEEAAIARRCARWS